MTDYIDREHALCELCNYSIPVFDENGKESFVGDYISVLNSIPAADVVEVVHGKWEERGVPVPYDVGGLNKIITTYCSVCGQGGEKWMHYCPNCGAKMEAAG